MFSKVKIARYEFRNPKDTLNEILPHMAAINVILEMERNGKWTHSQRNDFNFVISELLDAASVKIREGISGQWDNVDDVNDIPF